MQDWILGTVPTEPDMGSLVRLASVMCPISDTHVVLALGRPRSPIGVMLTPFTEPLCCQNFLGFRARADIGYAACSSYKLLVFESCVIHKLVLFVSTVTDYVREAELDL